MEPKPCKCGGTPVVRRVGCCKEYFVFFCSACGETPVPSCEARSTIRGAKRAWNRRTGEGEQE